MIELVQLCTQIIQLQGQPDKADSDSAVNL